MTTATGAMTTFSGHRTSTNTSPPIAAGVGRSSLTILILFTCALYILYTSNLIFLSRQDSCPTALIDPTTDLQLPPTNTTPRPEDDPGRRGRGGCGGATELKHIVFGIAASASLWERRKEYIKAWWRPGETRGVVWVDRGVRVRRGEAAELPEVRISGDTSRFKYTNRQGQRSALRISRVVSETLRLGMGDVRWYVMGDDDTVFVADNVVRALAKYDHTQFYYVGSSSESHVQNIYFSYAMAYGGGGFAISAPLANELEKMQDRCIQRYPALYGSDDRMQACMAELGVPLTREPGFHQVYMPI